MIAHVDIVKSDTMDFMIAMHAVSNRAERLSSTRIMGKRRGCVKWLEECLCDIVIHSKLYVCVTSTHATSSPDVDVSL